MLWGNEEISSALKMCESEEERRKIQAYAEDFLINMINGLGGAVTFAKNNPEKWEEAVKNHISKNKDKKETGG